MHELIKDANGRMNKSIEALQSELAKIRTGKATTVLLDSIRVDYYGNMVPLNQVGNVSVLDAHTLAITPWEKQMVQIIDKAILEANLGLNPISDGTNLKIPIPALNEERRKELVKLVRKFGEESRTAVSLCQENNLPMIVFNMDVKDNLLKLVMGEEVGTLINNGEKNNKEA